VGDLFLFFSSKGVRITRMRQGENEKKKKKKKKRKERTSVGKRFFFRGSSIVPH